VTCYLLTRRIISGLQIFVSRFIGYYIRRCLQSLITSSGVNYSWGTAVTTLIPDCCDNQCLTHFIVLTDRYWVVTITQLFWLPMLPCLQNCWEHFSCIRGYIILSVAWQWVFLALGNSAFQTCNIAPFLGLFVPNSPTASRRSFRGLRWHLFFWLVPVPSVVIILQLPHPLPS
jgi:hypothetical protein